MSKQSEAKKTQMYNPKPIHRTCSNCAHFTSEYRPVKWAAEQYGEEEAIRRGIVKETNMRCAIGGFAVKRGARCDIHKMEPLP